MTGLRVEPAVTVCIPTHNMARYLASAIESVLQQETPGCELVVCDDASSDETPSLCRRYGARLHYLRFDERGGQAANFNRCLAQGRGEFMVLLHADDLLLPGFIDDRVARLRAHPDAAFGFGAVRIIDADGRVVSDDVPWAEDRVFESDGLLESLLMGCVVRPPSMMVRRDAARRAGPFRSDLTWGHDWEWDFRLAEQGSICYAATPLAAYRVHDDSGTAEMLNAARNGPQERRILEETLKRLVGRGPRFARLAPAAFRALALRHTYFAERALRSGRPSVARNNLAYAARASAWIATRPTFWALVLASALGPSWYSAYVRLRSACRIQS